MRGGGGGSTGPVCSGAVGRITGAGGGGGGGFGLNRNGSRTVSCNSSRGALSACRSTSPALLTLGPLRIVDFDAAAPCEAGAAAGPEEDADDADDKEGALCAAEAESGPAVRDLYASTATASIRMAAAMSAISR